MQSAKYYWGLLRLSLGFIMLWAFVDKLFGLGFATTHDKAWLAGNSPTFSFLKFGTKGPFAIWFQMIAGSPIVDWLFMMGLMLIGLALLFGIGVRLAGYGGALMMLLMYLASATPPLNNPLIDEHIIYAIIFLAFTAVDPGLTFGFGRCWSEIPMVKKFPILK